ncbi:MAG TPA: ribonuclease HII [Candidatus Faecicola pullistercoris]|nr:ribonuclease HII [Candidatus Faecicola pullistercoris]
MIDVESLLTYEKMYLDRGCRYICGVDEVGRGPLAGPVTVAAYVTDFSRLTEGVNDSKKLSEKKREKLFSELKDKAVCYNVVSLDNNVIDKINILNATKQAMKQAIEGLTVKPDVVLIDAVELDIPYRTHSIIRGDALSYSIAAASIVAKVTRDRFMTELDAVFPEYGFASNKGYGSKKHIEALLKYGPTPLHRKTFIRNFVKDE